MARKITGKVCIVVGTRPEIIKMAPVMRACECHNIPFYIIHSGQHYSYNMDKIFLEELELPHVEYNLDVGSGTHGQQTGRVLHEIEVVLQKDRPGVVLVQGDTNTVLAGGLAAAKLHIPVGHIEAGLRSYDRTMPEEINRILTDHLSDFLFTPTEATAEIARQEGIAEEKIFVTGNTIVDAVVQNVKLAEQKSTILKQHKTAPGDFILVTMHRAENVDNKERLQSILHGVKTVSQELDMPVIFPIHPRTKKQILTFGLEKLLDSIPNINIIEPVGFLDFLILESKAHIILTDSGGVQEEACILQVPCISLRENTERPESVHVGASCIAGACKHKIVDGVRRMRKTKRDWHNPFGDGTAAEKIISILYQRATHIAQATQANTQTSKAVLR